MVFQNINTTSARPDDKALEWARTVEDENLSEESFFKVPKKFATLSRKLSSQLQRIATGELGRQITQKVEDCLKQGKSAPGLVLLRMILKYYSSGRHAEAVFNLNDLQKVTIKGGNLEGFQNTWNMVLKGMRKPPDEETLEFLYYEQVKYWRGISEDIAHYDRLEEGSGGDRTYGFLYGSVERSIARERKKRVQQELSQAIGKDTRAAPAAPGIQPSAKKKGKGKGKGDGKSNKGKGKGGKGRSSSAPPETGRQPKRVDKNGNLLCHFHLAGKCSRGKDCKFSHQPECKTKPLCKNFQAGKCKLGDKCKYSHETSPAAPAAKTKAKAKAKPAAPAIPVVFGPVFPAAPAKQVHVTNDAEYFYLGSEDEGNDEGYESNVGNDSDEYDYDTANTRLWLCDTACPFDLVTRDSIASEDEWRIVQADKEIRLATANGEIATSTVFDTQVEPLLYENGTKVHVLESTPDVLSIGKRCVELGYGFHWEPYSKRPYFVPPEYHLGERVDDGIIELISIGNVPYLPDTCNPPRKPQTISRSAAVPGVTVASSSTDPLPARKGGSEATKDTNESDDKAELPDEDEDHCPECDTPSRRNLYEEAQSLSHMMTHKPFNPYCRACVEGKSQRKQKRKGGLVEQENQPTVFGEQTTGDHLINRRKGGKLVDPDDNEDDQWSNDLPKASSAAVLFDRGTGWLTCVPQATKSAEDTVKAMQQFAGQNEIKSFYADNAPELTNAAKSLSWPMPTATPGIPATNGLAERFVRASKEGTRCNLQQSGLHKTWWRFAAPAFCFAHNTEGENSPYLKRYDVDCNHMRIPFGALVDYMPTPVADKPDPFESKTRPGIFLHPHAQPGGIWSGDYIIADFEVFRSNPNAEPKDVRIHRTKEVIPLNHLGPLKFPLAEYRESCKRIGETAQVFEPPPTPETGAVSSDADGTHPDDKRGQGGQTVTGRVVRKYTGSSRPPDIDPDVWMRFSPPDKRKAIAEYLETLENKSTSSSSGDARPAVPGIEIDTDYLDDFEDEFDDFTDVKTTVSNRPAVPMRIVAFSYGMRGDDDFVSSLIRQDPRTIKEFNLSGIKEVSDEIKQAISHPGVLVIFSNGKKKVSEFSLPRTLTTLWAKIATVVDGYGGTIAVRLPNGCEAWNLQSIASLVSGYHLETGHSKSLRPNVVFTNNVHWLRSLNYYECRDDRYEALHCCLAQSQCHKEQLAALSYIRDSKFASPAAPVIVVGNDAPRMPVSYECKTTHREREPEVLLVPYNCAVARKVTRREVEAEPKAKLAVDGEWTKLAEMPHPDGRGKGVWEEKGVEEASAVRKKAQAKGETVHFGTIAELCYEKGSELDDGDPLKKYKGRHVFLGDNVKDQDFQWAEFEHLGSAPASLEASLFIDAFSLQQGYEGTTSDAESAYTQQFLGGGRDKGTKTYVRIPKHRWPAWWHSKFRDPVVPLILALYGHVDAGGYWEEFCEKHVLANGFVKVENWPSCYWNKESQAALLVYVDDFKLACPKQHSKKIWDGIRKGIKMSDPEPFDRFLGCYLERFQVPSSQLSDILSLHPTLHSRDEPQVDFVNKDPTRKVTGYRYNMEQYLDKSVDKYCSVANVSRKSLRRVTTPFLNEGLEPRNGGPPAGNGGGSKSSGKQDADSDAETVDTTTGGSLNKVACSIIMTIMFVARWARVDLLRAVGHLSTSLHYWNEGCDKKLLRLMSYVNCTLGHRQVGFIGDSLVECELAVYADANFAERSDSKSTTGGFVALMGAHTFYPLGRLSKKQGSVSHSTVEAELVSLDTTIRCLGIPLFDLIETLIGKGRVVMIAVSYTHLTLPTNREV